MVGLKKVYKVGKANPVAIPKASVDAEILKGHGYTNHGNVRENNKVYNYRRKYAVNWPVPFKVFYHTGPKPDFCLHGKRPFNKIGLKPEG
jgi:hypothetical protein